jgi:thiol-disulfide isomerase/thioredoxin
MKVIDRIICFSLFFISIETAAQTTNFSGTWLIKERTSLTGVDYENGLAKLLNVNAQTDFIIIERLNIGSDGKEYIIVERLSFDGKPTTILRPGNRKRVSSIKWSKNGKVLINSTTGYKANSDSEMDYTFTEIWSFPETTKMLTVEITRQSANGEKFSMKGIYEQKTEAQLSYNPATRQGIRFENASDWENIKAKARQENKYIFVDCFATWCGPCKKMDAEIYPLNKVGDFMNSNFISMKLQMDTTQRDDEKTRNWYTTAHKFMQDYNIIGFPTFLFFSPDGKIVHKALGYYTTNDFLLIANDALRPIKQYYSQLENYRSGKKDYTTIGHLALTAKKMRDSCADTIAIDYKTNVLDKLSDDKIATRDNILFVSEFPNLVNSGSNFFRLLISYPNVADSLLKQVGFSDRFVNIVILKEEIANHVYYQGKINLKTAVYYEGKIILKNPDWNKISSNILQKYGKKYIAKVVIPAKLSFYRQTDWIEFVKLRNKVIEEIPPQKGNYILEDLRGAYRLNSDAWDVFQSSDDKWVLQNAVNWVSLAIKLAEPDKPSDYYDTKANLLYKIKVLYNIGDIKDAIALEKKAVALAYEMSIKYPNTVAIYNEAKETLSNMENGKRTW